jgi:hypothetical protein
MKNSEKHCNQNQTLKNSLTDSWLNILKITRTASETDLSRDGRQIDKIGYTIGRNPIRCSGMQ